MVGNSVRVPREKKLPKKTPHPRASPFKTACFTRVRRKLSIRRRPARDEPQSQGRPRTPLRHRFEYI